MDRPASCPRPAERLRELDALRGLAALVVVLYHYSYFIQFRVSGATLPVLQVRWGDDGVKLFFAISAFAMLATLDQTPTLWAFAPARPAVAARILAGDGADRHRRMIALAAMMVLAVAVGQAGDAWRDRRTAAPRLRLATT